MDRRNCKRKEGSHGLPRYLLVRYNPQGALRHFQGPESKVSENYNGNQVFYHLHCDVWDDIKNHYYNRFAEYIPDEKYPIEDENPFSADDYTRVPRGRITGTPTEYRVYHGAWMDEDFDYIKQLILDEFELDEDETTFVYDYHWDLGNGWGE